MEWEQKPPREKAYKAITSIRFQLLSTFIETFRIVEFKDRDIYLKFKLFKELAEINIKDHIK